MANSRPDFRNHQHHFPDHILLRYFGAVVGIVGIPLGAVALFVFGNNAVGYRCAAGLIHHNITDRVIALLMGDDKIVGLYGAAHAARQHNGGGAAEHGRSLHLKYPPRGKAIQICKQNNTYDYKNQSFKHPPQDGQSLFSLHLFFSFCGKRQGTGTVRR